MYRTQGVLAFLALYVGFVHSFSWDIVVARLNTLEFYNKGTLAHTATPASHRIKWISYDPVHDRVLFTEKSNREDSVSLFDITKQTTQSLIKKKTNRYLKRFAYDPATELLFGTVIKSIYSFPLGPGNSNEVNGDLVITLETIPREVAVDSCGGFIYWTTNNIIERALFNGSEREVIIDNTSNVTVRQALTVDSQKIYWIETLEYNDGVLSIESADLDGNNRITLHSETESDWSTDTLTVSNDFISWGDSIEKFFWQLPKNPSKDANLKPNKIALNTTIYSCGSHDIAAKYNIEERTQRVTNCYALLSLLPDVCLAASVFCVHGMKIIGESRCDCIQGYIGERCDVSLCENYCLQGDCNVSAEGQPTCRCNAGYTGERCDTSVCDNYCLQGDCNVSAVGQPTCRCNAGYTGERCHVSVCENYCSQGDCSVSAEGQPACRCKTGYSGARCDVNACYKHCLNNGTCSLNEEHEVMCQCTEQYEGKRCDVPILKAVSFHWLPLMDGELPPGAIIGGFEGEHTYIARANHSGSLCPGKYIKGTDTASIPWGGRENVKKHFEILCGFNAKWIKTNGENIPKNAFVGGRTGGPNEVGEPTSETQKSAVTTIQQSDNNRRAVAWSKDTCLVGGSWLFYRGLCEFTPNPHTYLHNVNRCNAGYTGERCHVSVCDNYCSQGDCSVSSEGQPACRCKTSYSGARCDINACYKHCLNNGTCSLNEEHEVMCQCTEQYEGKRCDVPILKADENLLNLCKVSFHWLPLMDGELPPGAIIGGFEGEHTYIARANHSGSLCPGKYIKGTDTASIPWGGRENVKKHFEILCGFNAKWIKTNGENIPKNAFVGGRTGGPNEVGGEPLYICRKKIKDSLVCGKAYARTKVCYLPYKGEEKQKTSYEILVEE